MYAYLVISAVNQHKSFNVYFWRGITVHLQANGRKHHLSGRKSFWMDRMVNWVDGNTYRMDENNKWVDIKCLSIQSMLW